MTSKPPEPTRSSLDGACLPRRWALLLAVGVVGAWLTVGPAGCSYDESGFDWSDGTAGDALPPALDADAGAEPADDAGATPQPPIVARFGADVVPIFERRGCIACHAGDGAGTDQGGLRLDGGERKIHGELTKEVSPSYLVTRVSLDAPEASVLLTLPLHEEPADAHPVTFFASTADPDYQILIAWIRAGARRD